VELFCRALTSPADIRAAVRRYPEVVGACTVTGEADALLHIRAADVGHFEQVVERIRAEPFTTRTRSVIVMSRLVDRTGGTLPSSPEAGTGGLARPVPAAGRLRGRAAFPALPGRRAHRCTGPPVSARDETSQVKLTVPVTPAGPVAVTCTG
jgi:Lrp/AsnC ligand binding domain